MPRNRKIPVPKLRVKRKLRGDGFFDTITSWGRSVVNAYTPKLITGIPAPSYTPDPTPPPIEGGLPDKSILKDIADNSYKATSDDMKDIPGFTLKLKTPTLVIYQKDTENMMVIGVRGTADFRDFKAWFSTAFNVIPDSQRFKEDIQTISDFQQKYPVNTYTYYATGHSLGGTLIDELIKKGMVKEARTYNPAIETSDIPDVALSQKNHRIYADGDPLYLLQGRFDNPTEVRKSYKYYPSSMYDFVPGYDKYKQHILANPVFVGGMTNPFYHLQGAARPYTADEWEQKLCKGENSLLAQKKRKIKERAEKGVPDLEAPMRTSRVIKATPPKEAQKYYFIFRGNPSRMYQGDGDVFIMTPDQLLAPDFRHRLVQTIDNNNREKQKENKSRKGTMASQLQKNKNYDGDNADRVAEIAQETFKDQSTLYNFKMGYEYTLDTLKKFAKKVSADEYANLKKEGRIFEKGLDQWALGSGLMANSQFYRTDPKRNPLLRGEGIWDDVKAGIEKVVGKPPISAHHVWTPAEQADINRRQRIIDVDKKRAEMVAKRVDYAYKNVMDNAQHKNVLQAYFKQVGTDNVKDYFAKVRELANKAAEEFYPY